MPSTFAINASALAAIDDLSLLAKTVVEGFFDGLHRSPFLGYSTEFSAYRPYVPGDSLRYIDWKVWGRTEEFYVKQFEDDTNVRCQIFLDTSASMDFGADNKFNYARTLAAVLSYLMVRQHDAPGLVVFGAQARQAAPASSTRHHADEILSLLTHAQAGGQNQLDQQLFQITETITRRGLAVVISDFLGASEGAFELLRRLHGQGQEVLVFHVLAPEELDLPFEGEFIMEDAESGLEIPVHPESFRGEYKKRVEEFCESVRKQCINHEIEYHRLRTNDPLDLALLAYLEKRAAF